MICIVLSVIFRFIFFINVLIFVFLIMFILWYKCIIFVSVCWYFIQLGVKLEYGVLVFWDCVYYIKVYICYDQFFLLSIIKEFLEVYQFVFVYIMRIYKVMRYVVQLEFDKVMIWQ